MLIRTQLASSRSPFMEEGTYAQVFTMHGTIMMFLFAIPMLEGAAIYLLPKMLGARDLAFPRLTAYGYWCYLFGGTMLLMGAAVRRGAGLGLVHVHTPVEQHLFTRHQCGCLAARRDLCRDIRPLRRGRADRPRS